jgi:hypothetical protein
LNNFAFNLTFSPAPFLSYPLLLTITPYNLPEIFIISFFKSGFAAAPMSLSNSAVFNPAAGFIFSGFVFAHFSSAFFLLIAIDAGVRKAYPKALYLTFSSSQSNLFSLLAINYSLINCYSYPAKVLLGAIS